MEKIAEFKDDVGRVFDVLVVEAERKAGELEHGLADLEVWLLTRFRALCRTVPRQTVSSSQEISKPLVLVIERLSNCAGPDTTRTLSVRPEHSSRL